MRRHYDAVDRTMRRAVDLGDRARETAAAAATAARTTDARYNPITVGNRIEKIEAELRAAPTVRQSVPVGNDS